MKIRGIVTAAHGRQYQVETVSGRTLLCYPRGKKSEIACGDRVSIIESGENQGVIEQVETRNSLLYRSNEHRTKLIAANVTQIIIVVATEPSFSDELVTRCLVAAESQGIRAMIILNKCDLHERIPAAMTILRPFAALDYPVIELCARTGAQTLNEYLDNHTSVLVGQSGMGKSTLINALCPEAEARTREISARLDSGKHTTTHATRYRINNDTALIDSPGLQEFGLHHLDFATLESSFREFRPLIGQCRFRNCQHDQEPGCAIRNAVESGEINLRRYRAFRTLCREIR